MPSKKIGIGVVLPLVITLLLVCGLFIYAPPTDQIEIVYEHLAMNTSGSGPAIGIAWVDPLTDVIFHNVGKDIEITFFIISPEYRAIDFDSVRYIVGDGVEVNNAEVVDISFDGWSACHYVVNMVCTITENTYINIRTEDIYGAESSRLFYVIALG